MTDSKALTRAIQGALRTTEHHAHQLLDYAARLTTIAKQYDLADGDAAALFLNEWGGLCRSLALFHACHHGRNYGGTSIPTCLAPYELLASYATSAEVNGVVGRSLCDIAKNYAREVRGWVRTAVPLLGPVATEVSQPGPVIRVTRGKAGPHGGFWFDIPAERLPAVQVVLQTFAAWDTATATRVKAELTQEVRRAWAHVPALIRDMFPADSGGPPVRELRDDVPGGSSARSANTPEECARTERQSVTQLTECLTSSGPLPPDLLAALNLAVEYATLVDTILFFARRTVRGSENDSYPRRIVTNAIDSIRAEYPYHGVLRAVFNELTAASDPNARFGEANAHQAAISLERRLMALVWRTADLEQSTRCLIDPSQRMDVAAVAKRFTQVCSAIAAEEWPDPKQITVACQVEAAKAALARGARASVQFPAHERHGQCANPGVVTSEPTARPPADWKAIVEGQVAAIYCGRPNDLDAPLADVFEAVAVAVRECTRLVASVPYLWERPDDYRALAQGVARAVESAREAYAAVDIRLRRAGRPNAVLDALNDAITVRDRAPGSPATAKELNPVLTQLWSGRADLFRRVEGRGVIDRMLEQLAHVPPEPATTLLVTVIDQTGSAAEEPAPEGARLPLPPIPAAVRNWLASRYLLDPTPDRFADSKTPVVLERLEPFCEFLLGQQLDVLPMLEACRAAGLIEDIRLDVSEVPGDLSGPLTRHVRRLNLPVGRHRILGIYKTATVPQPAEPTPAAETRATGRKGKCAGPNCGRAFSRIVAVWIRRHERSVSRLVVNSGGGRRKGTAPLLRGRSWLITRPTRAVRSGPLSTSWTAPTGTAPTRLRVVRRPSGSRTRTPTAGRCC